MHMPPVRTPSQRQPRNECHHPKSQDCEPRGRAVLLGSLTLLLFSQAPLPRKVSCCFSRCVPSDNSFLSVRHEPTLRPWKGVLLPVIPLSQFSHPFNGDCGPVGTVRQGWTLASSLMGHRCHQHTPGSTSLMASHQPGCSLSSLDRPQDHVNS